MPPKHRLAAKAEVKLADVVDEPFILLDDVHCFGDQVLSFCRRGGLEPRVVCRGEQIVTLLAMVAAGQGVSVVPEMAAVADTAKACVYRPLGKPAPDADALRGLAQAALSARRRCGRSWTW